MLTPEEKLEILEFLKQEKIKQKKEILEEIKQELNEAKIIKIELCRNDIKIPTYSNPDDAGMDIRSAENVIIRPGETKIIPTGIKIEIPTGYEIQVRPRSGISLKTPLRIANTPGTIDSRYRDEIGIIIENTSRTYNDLNIYSIDDIGNKQGIYYIEKGDRVAQIVLSKCEKIKFEQVETGYMKTLKTNRGGGYGHTGIKWKSTKNNLKYKTKKDLQ